MYKMPKSKRGAVRQYWSIIAAYRRVYSDMFGCDWVTFKINQPEAYQHLAAIRNVFSQLPD